MTAPGDRDEFVVLEKAYDQVVEATAIGDLGNVLTFEGRFEEARACQRRFLEITRELGDRQGEAFATMNLGTAYLSEGLLVEAHEQFANYLSIARGFGHRLGESIATGNIGLIFQAQGQHAMARAHYERCLELSREIAYREGAAIALQNLGNVLREQGDDVAAAARLEECIALGEAMGDRYGVAVARLALAALRADAGDVATARTLLESARDTAIEFEAAGEATLARCRLAGLPGGEVGAALEAFASNEAALRVEERREAKWLLWRLTGARAHLEDAKRLLDITLASAPAEHHESMRSNIRLHREITDAARAAGL